MHEYSIWINDILHCLMPCIKLQIQLTRDKNKYNERTFANIVISGEMKHYQYRTLLGCETDTSLFTNAKSIQNEQQGMWRETLLIKNYQTEATESLNDVFGQLNCFFYFVVLIKFWPEKILLSKNFEEYSLKMTF